MTHKQIAAAEEMMKLAINNQNHVNALVGYYRDLIDNFNNQRAQWVIQYNHLKQNAENQYLLDQQILTAKQHLTQLEMDLASKKASLTYERQKYFKFIETNGTLKKKLEDAKQNYRGMMNVCKPVGCTNKFSNSFLGTQGESKQSELENRNSPLELQLINMHRDHEKKKQKKKGEIDVLKQQLSGLIQQFGDRDEECISEYHSALQKLGDLQKKNMRLTSEYFRYRTSNAQQQKKLQQESEIYRLRNLAIFQKLKNLQQSHSQEFKSVDSEVKRENNAFKKKYDKQLKKKEEHLSILKQQHQRIQDIYLTKIKKMQQQLKETNTKLKICEEKGRVEINSLKSQIKILRTRLQNNIGVHNMRGEMASKDNSQDMDSSASLQMSELERINKEVTNLAKQIDKKK